jgi:hypothetical protein
LHSENFSYARDFLYLAGILLGISAGFFLSFFKKSLSRGQKERRLTAGICILSAVLLSSAASFILSNGAVLRDEGLIIATLCVMAIGVFVALFPEIFLLPLIIPGGICVALASYLFLRYPQAGSFVPVTRLTLPASDTIMIEPEYPKFALANYNKIVNFVDAPPQYKNYYNKDRPFTLEYSAIVLTVNRLTPFIGGQQRSVLLGLNLIDARGLRLKLYNTPRLEDSFVSYLLLHNQPFINAQSFFDKMKLNDLEPHTDYTVYFDCFNSEIGNGSGGGAGGGGGALYKLSLSSVAYEIK